MGDYSSKKKFEKMVNYHILSDMVGVVDREDRLEAVDPEDGIISEADSSCA